MGLWRNCGAELAQKVRHSTGFAYSPVAQWRSATSLAPVARSVAQLWRNREKTTIGKSVPQRADTVTWQAMGEIG